MLPTSLIIINILDALLHIVTNQAETLRISSNLVIIISTSLLLLKKIPNSKRSYLLALSAYIALNGLFILINGIGPVGMVLIFATIALQIKTLFK